MNKDSALGYIAWVQKEKGDDFHAIDGRHESEVAHIVANTLLPIAGASDRQLEKWYDHMDRWLRDLNSTSHKPDGMRIRVGSSNGVTEGRLSYKQSAGRGASEMIPSDAKFILCCLYVKMTSYQYVKVGNTYISPRTYLEAKKGHQPVIYKKGGKTYEMPRLHSVIAKIMSKQFLYTHIGYDECISLIATGEIQ